MARKMGTVASRERELRTAAAEEAATLFRERGAEAIDLLTERMTRPELSADERRRNRLARLEVERLDRERRKGPSTNALIVWKPPLFSVAGFAALFGIKIKRSRRRR